MVFIAFSKSWQIEVVAPRFGFWRLTHFYWEHLTGPTRNGLARIR